MDYTSLTGAKSVSGSIADWTNDSRMTTADAAAMVQEAESAVYRRLRHWRMLSAPVPGIMTIDQDNITTPDDFLEPFTLFVTGVHQLVMLQKTPDDVYACWSYDQNGARVQTQPLIYSFNDTNIFFDSPPDLAYPYALVYYQQPAPLSASGTNWLTNFYPRLLRCACMTAATEWLKESGQGTFDRTYWTQQTMDELHNAQMESDRARRGVVDFGYGIGGGNPGMLPVY